MTNPDISPVPPGLPVTREQIFGFCHKYHIISFVFFGSAVRGTLRPDSDIDIMVIYDPDHPHTFSGYLDMIHELEDMFGRKVDLVDRNQITGTRNYLRRIGMLENLLPTHRQESYLLDILLFLEELAGYPFNLTWRDLVCQGNLKIGSMLKYLNLLLLIVTMSNNPGRRRRSNSLTLYRGIEM